MGLPLIPDTHLACFATLAYGAVVGVATAWLMKLGEVRNEKVAGLMAGAVAAVSLYCSWAFWVQNIAHTEATSLVLMQRPALLWDLIKTINQHGTWGMSQQEVGQEPTNMMWVAGGALWAFWIAEAVVMIGSAYVAAALFMRSGAFCESCGRWCGSFEELYLTPAPDVRQAQRDLAVHDLKFLDKLTAGNKKERHLHLALRSCSRCQQLNVATAHQSFFRDRIIFGRTLRYLRLADKILISRLEADAFRQAARRGTLSPEGTFAGADIRK